MASNGQIQKKLKKTVEDERETSPLRRVGGGKRKQRQKRGKERRPAGATTGVGPANRKPGTRALVLEREGEKERQPCLKLSLWRTWVGKEGRAPWFLKQGAKRDGRRTSVESQTQEKKREGD